MWLKICLMFLLCCYCSKMFAEIKIPSSIQHCRRNDPKTLDCIVKAEHDAIKLFTNGYSERNIDPIEPIEVETIIIKGKPNKQFRLDQIYKNIKIHGFTGIIFKKLNGSIHECLFHQKLYFPRIEILSDYEIHGNLLLFNINGIGKSNVTLKGVAAQIKLSCEYYEENNIEYIKFKDLIFKMKVKNVYLHFDNLVDGNKELSDVINNVLNENAIELFDEYNEPYGKSIGDQLLLRANKFIKDIPVSKLFLPDI